MAKLVSYHEHNERERAAELVAQMQTGAVVALVSDAGMPLVSDPGFVLVRSCVAAGLAVEVLPGPSAGAVGAGRLARCPPTAGASPAFCPASGPSCRRCSRLPETVVAFESPRRVGASLKTLAALDPDRPVAVCRELTKLHEEVVRGSAAELAERYAGEAPRGEIVLVVGPAPAADARPRAGAGALRRLIEAGAKPRPAASVVAELTGIERQRAVPSVDREGPDGAGYGTSALNDHWPMVDPWPMSVGML